MSCERSYGQFLAAACAPSSPLSQTLGAGDPLVTRSVLEEVFSIVQERAAQALTQRQAPGERLQKPIHQLQQRGADAAARDDCARLFRQIAADTALWEAMRPLAERSPDDREALGRVVNITCGAPYKITCGAPYKLVQLKIDQAKQGGGPS